MLYLKQSTASQSVLIGPFVDATDGVTAETGLTIANTDIRLSANGGNMAAKNSGGGTHDEEGFYSITLDATDTATVGRLQLSVQDAAHLPVYHEFWVLEEDIYDALFGASAAGFDTNQRVDVGSWLGNAVTASSGNPDVNIESIDASAITATSIATDAITAAKIAADAIGASELATDAVAEIADAVLDEALAGHTTAGTLGKAVADIETDATAILADTNELQTDDVPGLIATAQADLDIITGADGVNLLSATQASIDAIEVDTAEIGTAGAGLTDLGGMSTAMKAEVNTEVDGAFTTQMADSVPADGTIPTREQAIYMIAQFLFERVVSTTTVSVKKVDGSTELMTLTLDDGTNPTSITRAT